ncbi:MAG: histidinol dehydrogenase [Acidobacteria bacterium]|nr:histidinol dehydrogenase [Acidobacteriota bacterium]
MLNASSPEAEAALRAIEARRNESNEEALRLADEAIAGVRARGDAYVREQVARFDGVSLAELRIEPREATIAPAMAAAIDVAIERVASFHAEQLPSSYRWTREGTDVLHRVRPLRRAGLYVPGGRAVYLSTLIMCAVPARIAGVRELVVATTPAAAGTEELHYACNRLGIRELYRAGGAAGIAALALGTESLARVDKIVGPGNPYVTAAKARLVGTVGIDMTAGPTELVVIADESAKVDYVQADLDAQAEHGPDSAVICISVGRSIEVRATLSLLADSMDQAIAIANRIAPEHLSIHAAQAERIADSADNCGAIFCGPFAPVAAGDYIAGPNHVLPTGGSARFFSPLGVYDFVKRSNVISMTGEALAGVAEHAIRIARFEGLPAHAESIERRTA